MICVQAPDWERVSLKLQSFKLLVNTADEYKEVVRTQLPCPYFSTIPPSHFILISSPSLLSCAIQNVLRSPPHGALHHPHHPRRPNQGKNHTSPARPSPRSPPLPIQHAQCPDYCKGTSATNDTSIYICGDPRLGPITLPTFLPLSTSTTGYDRFGGQCPGAFLTTWYNSTSSPPSYIYPPLAGYQAKTDGSALVGNITLQPGALIDRFGSEYGTYLAPFGTPYEQRALPPANLDTYDTMFPYEYYVYEVLKPLGVMAGPIAGWFEQMGQGTQYQADQSVMALVAGGWLRRVSTEELLAPGIDV